MRKTNTRRTKRHRTKRHRTKHHRAKHHRAKGTNLDNTDNNGYTLRNALQFYSDIITQDRFYNNRDIEKLINNINKIRKPSNTNFKVTPSLLHNIKMAKKQLKRLPYQVPPVTKTLALKHLLELLDKLILLESRPKMRRGDRVNESVWTPWDPKAILMDSFIHL